MHILNPSIQHYAWGGKDFIPQWLGLKPDEQPSAEAWYGAHPNHSSTILVYDQQIKLTDWISQQPIETLGAESIKQYGPRLPFLLKILDVKDMLSIQLHPDKHGAETGFKDENAKGIPLTAPHRNYKDDNHKPEMLIALSDFWMLQGFESLEKIRVRIENLIPEFMDQINEWSWKTIIHEIWGLSTDQKNHWCHQVQFNLKKINIDDKNDIGYWLKKALATYPPSNGDFDRGILVMLMMHVQYLRPGEAGYQAAGVLHAYLEGQNVELMSNSDNVLRGGLTPKHIDAIELMRHLNASDSGQCLLDPIYLMDDEIVFSPPVPDFMIKHYKIQPGTKKLIQFNTASILLLQEGDLEYDGKKLNAGKSLFIPAYGVMEVTTMSESCVFFVATTTLS